MNLLNILPACSCSFLSDSFGNVTTPVSFEETYSSSVTLVVPSCVLASCEFNSNIFVVAWTSEVIPEETVVAFPSTSGVLVVDWMSDVTTAEVVVALLSVDWTSDVTPDEVVVDISSTSGVVVVVWTPDVTIEVDVSLPSTVGVFVVDGISEVTTEEVVVKDPSPIEVLVIADIIVEVVGSTVLVALSTVSSVVAGSGVTTFDISVVTRITTVDVGPVYLINIVIFL